MGSGPSASIAVSRSASRLFSSNDQDFSREACRPGIRPRLTPQLRDPKDPQARFQNNRRPAILLLSVSR